MQQCPLCYSPLEVRDVAPCYLCGAIPQELEHFRSGEHSFCEYEFLWGHRIVLCDICALTPWDPEYFGLPRETKLSWKDLHLLRRLDNPSLALDKFCPSCGLRMKYLTFVQKVREGR